MLCFAMQSETSGDLYTCFCKNLPQLDLLTTESEYCQEYINAFAISTLVLFSACVTVMLMNYFIDFAVIVITKFEKHVSRSHEDMEIANKVRVGM